VKEDRRDVVGRVDGAAVRQRRTAVAADAARRRPRSVVDLQEVRLAVGMFLELEARERQHQRLTRQHTHASVRSSQVNLGLMNKILSTDYTLQRYVLN